MIEVIAFDVFGTVVDLSRAPREEIQAYARHIRQPTWSKLELPKSWEDLPPHPDSVEGLAQLRKNYHVVTCSNAPLGFLSRLSKKAGLVWDAIVPLELNQVYKPDPRAYLTICEVLGVKPSAVRMVTANKDFGDLEGSASVGMASTLIRHPDALIADILDLARHLG